MATVREIYQAMDRFAPFQLQMEFDNAGFLVGHSQNAVSRILVALDITLPVVEEAVRLGCQLIVAHHPVIFHPARSITDENNTGRILLALAEHNIAAICAHTNLDAVQGGVNCCLAQRLGLLEIEQLHADGVDSAGRPYGIGRIGLPHETGLTPSQYAAYVQKQLGAASVRFVDTGCPVKKVAVGGGSCGSMLADVVTAGCDTFVTSDVKYDQYLEAKALGICLMDAGHYATEHVVCQPLAEHLRSWFPEVEVALSQAHVEAYAHV